MILQRIPVENVVHILDLYEITPLTLPPDNRYPLPLLVINDK